MGKIVAIANQKGGVGKTTTCINLAASMAATKRKVLVIDLDPQGNATMASGVDKYMVDATAYDLLVEDTPFDQVVCTQTTGKYDLIAANGDVTAAEIKLMEVFAREVRLKNALSSVRDNYDFIFIDCPPSLGLITLNALVACDEVLIPMLCDFYSLEGLSHLLKTIEIVEKKMNPAIKIGGILFTMYDKRNKLTEQVENDVRTCLGKLVYKTTIPRNVKVSEAPSHGKAAIIYDYKCSGSRAYIDLAKEIIDSEVNKEIKLV